MKAKLQSKEDRRNALTVTVLHDLAVHNSTLPVTAKDGSQPVVVALDDDLLSAVFGRVRLSGGRVNLFVQMEGHHDVALFSASLGPAQSSSTEVFSSKPMHENTTIGMVAEYVLKAPDGVQMRVKLTDSNADVQYVERRELTSA